MKIPKIIIDTREQKPWIFPWYNTEKQTLAAGDYSLEGLQNKLIIERKSNISELKNNLVNEFERFCKEFDKLSECENIILICEFPYEQLSEFPHGGGVSLNYRYKTRVSANLLISRLNTLIDKYNINTCFADNRDRANLLAEQILIRTYEENENIQKNA